ncbi:hypothetical protein BH09ACT5_BH09ACT5_20900 [soil metagenome]
MMSVWAVQGIPEIVPGDDLAAIIGDAIATGDEGDLQEGDILAVTSKIVSKAEGRLVEAADRDDAITAESVRVVATRGATRIVENRLGLVLAAAGVDSSNTPDGHVLLLPEDPDASARALAAALRGRFGVALGVVVTDTLGRPWREGQVDAAIGAAGIRVLDDLRGSRDANGRLLEATVAATADEIASAADLVKGKAGGLPVAVVRGLGHLVGELDQPGARALVRSSEIDMFRLGTREAWDEGYRAGLHAAQQ